MDEEDIFSIIGRDDKVKIENYLKYLKNPSKIASDSVDIVDLLLQNNDDLNKMVEDCIRIRFEYNLGLIQHKYKLLYENYFNLISYYEDYKKFKVKYHKIIINGI